MIVKINGENHEAVICYVDDENGVRVDVFESQGEYRVRMVDTDADEVFPEIMIYKTLEAADRKAMKWSGNNSRRTT